MIIMNHLVQQNVTWKQIEIKNKIWSGLGETVRSHPQACRKFFSNLSFGKTEDLSCFDLYRNLQFTFFTFPVLKNSIGHSLLKNVHKLFID